MMHEDLALTVIGMWAVTFFPRWLPVFALSNRKLPEPLIKVLEMIPVALLSAIVFPSIFVSEGSLDVTNTHCFTAVPTILIAYVTRSLIGTIVGGMLVYWLAGYLG